MTTHHQLVEAVRDFSTRLARAMNDVMRLRGASLAQMKLLTFIQYEQPVRSIDISDAFGVAPRTVTEAIDALERDGLINRTPDPKDRRAKRINITDAGKAVIVEVEPYRAAFAERLFDILDTAEEAALLGMLDKLTHRLTELATELPSAIAEARSGKEKIHQS